MKVFPISIIIVVYTLVALIFMSRTYIRIQSVVVFSTLGLLLPTAVFALTKDRTVILDVPFVAQAPTGEWGDPRLQDACEEAVSFMAHLWKEEKKAPPKKKAKKILLAIVSAEEKNYGSSRDTSAADTRERIIKGYYGITNVELSEEVTTSRIRQELLAGNIVIVPTNGQALKNPFYRQPGPERHMVVIKGHDPKKKQFITNDPGTKNGKGYRYSTKRLLKAVRDYPTGDHVSIVGTKKIMIIVKKKLPLSFDTSSISFSTVQNILNAITPEPIVSLPEPMRLKPSSEKGVLTSDGIFAWTNSRREQEGVSAAFIRNAELDRIAKARLDDLFQKQYFEHVSPLGESVTTVATAEGYPYILIGENLALGNFKHDEDVVNAWMNSPGHRANILKAGYSDLGVAARKDMFEGREAWIAVQIFSRPKSACPQEDDETKKKIDALSISLEQQKKTIDEKRTHIESLLVRTQEEAEYYNVRVNEYNATINAYNADIPTIKKLVSMYNARITEMNECIKGLAAQ